MFGLCWGNLRVAGACSVCAYTAQQGAEIGTKFLSKFVHMISGETRRDEPRETADDGANEMGDGCMPGHQHQSAAKTPSFFLLPDQFRLLISNGWPPLSLRKQEKAWWPNAVPPRRLISESKQNGQGSRTGQDKTGQAMHAGTRHDEEARVPRATHPPIDPPSVPRYERTEN